MVSIPHFRGGRYKRNFLLANFSLLPLQHSSGWDVGEQQLACSDFCPTAHYLFDLRPYLLICFPVLAEAGLRCPVSPAASTYEPLRPQPCFSCRRKYPHTHTHTYTHSNTNTHAQCQLGLPSSPIPTLHPTPCGLTLRYPLNPGSQTTSPTHWLTWLGLGWCSHTCLHTYTCSCS